MSANYVIYNFIVVVEYEISRDDVAAGILALDLASLAHRDQQIRVSIQLGAELLHRCDCYDLHSHLNVGFAISLNNMKEHKVDLPRS